VHGRRRVGQGETFWQYRHYEPGDPNQVIDWRQSAKSDHVFARQMEWEAAQSAWIWRDSSASMDWRSSDRWPTKRDRADLLALALAACGPSGDPETGAEAYDRGDYATALEEWRPLAEQGDAGAQFNLGLLYDMGRGVPQNYAEAAKWYRLAADGGYDKAQFNLALMYNNGTGVTQDYAEAVKWFRLAAEQGDALAQYNLGVMYGNKEGVSQDYVQAHLWLNIAASHLPPGEVRDLAVSNRDLVEKQMTPEQIAEAQRLAREWKPK
jgi:hypothetical protein